MDKDEIIARLTKIANHAAHTVGEDPFVMSLDDGIALHEAIAMLKNGIDAVETQENSIVLGRDYWSRYYNITEKEWRTEDGEFFDKSFCIVKKGEGDAG